MADKKWIKYLKGHPPSNGVRNKTTVRPTEQADFLVRNGFAKPVPVPEGKEYIDAEGVDPNREQDELILPADAHKPSPLTPEKLAEGDAGEVRDLDAGRGGEEE